MRFLRTIARHVFTKWTIGVVGAVVLAAASFYKYQFEMRPVLEVTVPDPVQVHVKVETFRFDIPIHYRNAGHSTAAGVKTYHVFFTYPPGFEDLAETDVPDIPANNSQYFTLVKYLETETLNASINFFEYQNLIVVTTWHSDNLSHFRKLFSQAQWYRLYLHMQEDLQLGSYLTLVKSRYYHLWNMQGKEALKEILGRFFEGETWQGAYNLEEIEWSTRKD